MDRITALRDFMKKESIDGVWVSMPENLRYYTGFTGTTGEALITQEKQFFYTDFRYLQQAAKQCAGYEIKEVNKDIGTFDYIFKSGLDKIAYEDMYISAHEFKKFEEKMPGKKLYPLGETLRKLRSVKYADELENLYHAAEIADEAFKHMLNFIKPGLSEKEVALELEFKMRKLGASGLSFTTIAASGIRSSMPHGVASDKIIEKNDFLTLDFRCVYNGYCSDMTRTIVVGKANDRQKEIYSIVLETQLEVLKHIRPGAKCSEVDKVSRDIIGSYGYGKYYGHGLGHGVGLEIHELPVFNPSSEDILYENNIVTDEPGIYIPDFGGVRIEDTVRVTSDGCDRVSKSPKELIELDF